MDVIFGKNIGFIYDLCQVIICKTSKRESWISTFILNGREETDIPKTDLTLSQFSNIDRCWNIFTILHPKKGRLLTKLYIDFMRSHLLEENPISFIEFLSNANMLRERVYEWYFDTNNFTETDCYRKLQNIDEIGDSIRLSLYELFTDSDKYVDRMKVSLKLVLEEMKIFYMKHEEIMEKRKICFHYSKLENKEPFLSSNPAWANNINRCVVSFSLINRYMILRDELNDQTYGWILLGIDYDAEMIENIEHIDLAKLGNALGDKLRVKILKEIHQNGEQTLTDLSRTFNSVNAVMLYHLDILRAERLLGQRHEGRRVYYWLNYGRLKQLLLTINSEFGGELIEALEKA